MLAGAISAIGPVSVDMYLPGFPAIEREFAQRGVESTMAAYLVGIAVGQLFYGPISDRYGRKPPLYVGFALYTLGALGCALASNLTMLMLMRVVQALGGCAGIVISRAIVRDRCEPHEAARAFSTLMMIFALGPIIAPAAGGLVVSWFGWRATFAFQAALGIVLGIAMHKILDEPPRQARAAARAAEAPAAGPLAVAGAASAAAPERGVSILGVLRSYLHLLTERVFLGYTLLGGFGLGALFTYVTGAPIVLTRQYDISPQQFGMLIGLNGLAFFSASRLNVLMLRTLPPYAIISRCVWLPLVLGTTWVLIALFLPLPLWLLVVLQLAFFISVGCVNPNVAALALAPHGRQAGTASALMGAVQSGLATLSGATVALFNDGTVGTLVIIMTAGVACSCASYLWVRLSVAPELGARAS